MKMRMKTIELWGGMETIVSVGWMFIQMRCSKICLLTTEFTITHQPESFSQFLSLSHTHSLCLLHLQRRNLQFYPTKKVLENFSLEKETKAPNQFYAIQKSCTNLFGWALSRERKSFYCIYDFTNRLEAKCVTQHLNVDSFVPIISVCVCLIKKSIRFCSSL